MKTMLTVGLGEMTVTADRAAVLACLGLGSCIALCAYEPRRRIGALVHVVLPGGGGASPAQASRYADTAIPALASELARLHVRLAETRVVLCGGASIFPPLKGVMDIGARNIDAVRAALAGIKLRTVQEEVGGTESRTLLLDVGTGMVRLRTVRKGEYDWICLGSQP